MSKGKSKSCTEWLIGFDPGFGDTKVVFAPISELNQGKEPQSFSFPTLIAESSSDLAPTNPIGNTFEEPLDFGGKKYVVGEKALSETGYFQLYDIKDMLTYIPLILKYALMQIFKNDNKDYKLFAKKCKKTVVCTALPPEWWNEYRREVVRRLKETLNVKAIVIPQGVGAFWLVKNEVETGAGVLLLDIGYNTLDYLYLIKEEINPYFRVQTWGTLTGLGVIKLEELFRTELSVRDRNLPDVIIKKALKKGKIRIRGAERDFSEEKARAVEKYNKVLMQRLKGVAGRLAVGAEAVVLTGGGVHYFKTEDFDYEGRIIVVKKGNPEFGNAWGQFLILKEETGVIGSE